MTSLPKYTANMKLLIISLVLGIVLMAIKFAAFYITGSNAIFSDALESIVNVIAAFISFISVVIAASPKDKNHPYGHGKVEFLSAGFEGIFILLAGIIIIAKSVYNLFVINVLSEMISGIILTAFTGLANYIMGFILVNNGKKSSSAAMIASGEHLKTDTYTTAGLLIGLLLIWFTDIWWLDQAIAILFAFVILFTGYKIVRSSLSGILDETDTTLVNDIIAILNKNRQDNWIDIHNLRVIKYGAALHIDCHVTLPWYFNLQQAHEEITKIDDLVNHHLPNKVELFIHEDPCVPTSCHICNKQHCDVRKQPYQYTLQWNIDTVLSNKKHGIET